MAHPPRRPWLLGLLAFGALAFGALLSLPRVAASAEDFAGPTVTFTRVGACSAHPDVTSIEIPAGMPVLVVNRTGGDVTVLVGSMPALDGPLPDLEGALLTLAPGEHEVRMVPSCGGGPPVTVRVTPPAGPDDTATGPPATDPDAMSSPPAATPTSPPVAGPGLPSGSAAVPTPPRTAQPKPEPSAVIEARRVDVGDGGNPKAVRLLAIVATICVLGVTAAIIRSIVRLSP